MARRVSLPTVCVVGALLISPGCGAARPTPTARATAPALPGPLAGTTCNDRQLWSTTAWPLAKVAAADLLAVSRRHGVALPADGTAQKTLRRALRGAVFWWLIRSLTVDGHRNNAGALLLRGATTRSGAPLWLVRSGYTAQPSVAGSCYRGLVDGGGVRHVLNLYDGEMVTTDLDAAEAMIIKTHAGATYAHPAGLGWRGAMRKTWRAAHRAGGDGDPTAYLRARGLAATVVAKTINTHLLRPAGRPPIGHLLVHCGGGMHRTGMVVGVLDRCINHTPMARIEADYKHHVGWHSAKRPGGYEAQNLDFIGHFPCALLKTP